MVLTHLLLRPEEYYFGEQQQLQRRRKSSQTCIEFSRIQIHCVCGRLSCVVVCACVLIRDTWCVFRVHACEFRVSSLPCHGCCREIFVHQVKRRVARERGLSYLLHPS